MTTLTRPDAHAERVRRWVEVRPRSVRLSNGRTDKHPRKGHKNDWKKGV